MSLELFEADPIEVKYEGFAPESILDSYVRSELAKVMESCPYDSTLSGHFTDRGDRFSVELTVRHQLGQFTALGEEVSLSESLGEALQSLYYQIEDWRETRFVDKNNVARPLSVLLVDDDPISIKLLESCFKRLGCKTYIAIDGEEAVEAIERENFDLLIMDWHMPYLNGRKTLSAIDRKLKKDQKLPVITYSISDKSKISFPKTRHLVPWGHLPKSTSYRTLRGFTKSFLSQLNNNLDSVV